MTPTLYTDDLGTLDQQLWPETEDFIRLGLAAILPTRCTAQYAVDDEGGVHWDMALLQPCDSCDGRSWTYPDPPDWWRDELIRHPRSAYDMRTFTEAWHDHLHITWRTLGIETDTTRP